MDENAQILEKVGSILTKLQAVKSNSIQNTQVTQNVQDNIQITESISPNISIDEIKNFIQQNSNQPIFFKENDHAADNIIIDDIAIIQGFFGTNIDRILSVQRSLKYMLKSNPKPAEWIFIEAQTSKSKRIFSWVQDYGIKYIFRKINSESDGLFLKTALWNIGAFLTKSNRLCFIDADIVFCSQNWLSAIDSAFKSGYDVMSLAGWVYYAETDIDARKGIRESIGHVAMRTNEQENEGHIGFNIGMTRFAWEEYGRFEAFSFHDDEWIWSRIFGSNNRKLHYGWLPYKMPDEYARGLPFRVGSTDEICCHIDHGCLTYDISENAGRLTYDNLDIPFEEISYNRQTLELPKWANNYQGKIIKQCFKDIIDGKYDNMTYYNRYCEVYGQIDDNHPLVIATIWKKDFLHKTSDCVIKHKQMFEKYCQHDFIYVCFSNEEIEGIDTIQYKIKKTEKLTKSVIDKILHQKNIVYPKNCVILYSDLYDTITDNFYVFHDTKMNILTIKNIY